MEWVPWGAVVTLGGLIVGWLWRLSHTAAKTADQAAATKEDLKQHVLNEERAQEKREEKVDRAIASVHGEVTMTNSRIGVVEHSITELRVTAITRVDLEKMEGRLTGNVQAIGERIDDFMAKVATDGRASSGRSRTPRTGA
jgi:hypothetical protein